MSLFILDEMVTCHCHSIEALDRPFKEIKQNTITFDGRVLLFARDFRQNLPVVPSGSNCEDC